jgi:hypothetical protein
MHNNAILPLRLEGWPQKWCEETVLPEANGIDDDAGDEQGGILVLVVLLSPASTATS